MNYVLSPRFETSFRQLESAERKMVKKAVALLIANPRHPSLKSKKIKGREGFFESRASLDFRLTWEYLDSETVLLRNCGHHDDTLRGG